LRLRVAASVDPCNRSLVLSPLTIICAEVIRSFLKERDSECRGLYRPTFPARPKDPWPFSGDGMRPYAALSRPPPREVLFSQEFTPFCARDEGTACFFLFLLRDVCLLWATPVNSTYVEYASPVFVFFEALGHVARVSFYLSRTDPIARCWPACRRCPACFQAPF